MWRCMLAIGGHHAAIMSASGTRVWRCRNALWRKAWRGFCGTGRVSEIVRLTQTEADAAGDGAGVAASTVRAVWQAHGLTPHR